MKATSTTYTNRFLELSAGRADAQHMILFCAIFITTQELPHWLKAVYSVVMIWWYLREMYFSNQMRKLIEQGDDFGK